MSGGADDPRAAGHDDTVAAAALETTVARTVTDTGDALAATVAGHRGSRQPPDDDWVGRTIGRYRLERRLGAGGMGVVWAALDPALDRRVALKVLPPLDAERRAHLEVRLRREAQALARLEHPNVVAVYDVGVAAESVFIAMQLIDGTTLDHHLARVRPPPATIIELFLDACRGLAAAHAAGIIHRDVKPSNLLVDQAGRVYVGDFGLARGADAPDDAAAADHSLLSAEMTRAGAVMGTPLYMAPEQHAGEPATARADQYSLCVSLWEALFEHHPFAAGRWDHDAALAAMRADRIAEPPRRRGVPARVVRALRRGLRVDPAARWDSMDRLAEAIAPRGYGGWVAAGAGALGIAGAVALTLGLTTGSASPLTKCRAGAGAIRETWPARATTLRAAILDAGIPGASAAADRVAGVLDRHAARWRATRLEVCAATHQRGERGGVSHDLAMRCLESTRALTDEVVTFLIGASRTNVFRAVEVVGGLPDPSACSSPARAAQAQPAPAILAEVERIQTGLQRLKLTADADHWGDARAVVERLVADAERIGFDPLLATAYATQARIQAEFGGEGAADLTLKAAERATAGGDDLTAARGYTMALMEAGNDTNLERVAAIRAMAEATARRVGTPEALAHFRVADGWSAMAADRIVAGRQLCDGVAADTQPGISADVRAQALTCALGGALDQDDLEAASRWAERAVAVAEDAYGPGTYTTSDELANLALVRRRQGRLDEALDLITRARQLQAAARGDDDLDIARLDLTRAQLLHQRGRAAEGIPLVTHALAVLAKGDVHGRTEINGHTTLGQLHDQAGDPVAAASEFDRAATLARTGLPANDSMRAVVLYTQARFLVRHGSADQAGAALDEAAAIWRHLDSPRVANADLARGRLLARAGRHREAAALLDAVVAALTASGHDPDALLEARLAQATSRWDADIDRAAAVAVATAVTAEARAADVAEVAAAGAAWLAAHPLTPAGAAARPETSPP